MSQFASKYLESCLSLPWSTHCVTAIVPSSLHTLFHSQSTTTLKDAYFKNRETEAKGGPGTYLPMPVASKKWKQRVDLFCKLAVQDPVITTGSSDCLTATAKSLQLCLTLCDPIDGSPPGSPIPGILQARTLEWVAISFSNA